LPKILSHALNSLCRKRSTALNHSKLRFDSNTVNHAILYDTANCIRQKITEGEKYVSTIEFIYDASGN